MWYIETVQLTFLLKNRSNLFFWLTVKPFRVGGIDEIMVNVKENIEPENSFGKNF